MTIENDPMESILNKQIERMKKSFTYKFYIHIKIGFKITFNKTFIREETKMH